jgi:hypothetical protein
VIAGRRLVIPLPSLAYCNPWHFWQSTHAFYILNRVAARQRFPKHLCICEDDVASPGITQGLVMSHFSQKKATSSSQRTEWIYAHGVRCCSHWCNSIILYIYNIYIYTTINKFQGWPSFSWSIFQTQTDSDYLWAVRIICERAKTATTSLWMEFARDLNMEKIGHGAAFTVEATECLNVRPRFQWTRTYNVNWCELLLFIGVCQLAETVKPCQSPPYHISCGIFFRTPPAISA